MEPEPQSSSLDIIVMVYSDKAPEEGKKYFVYNKTK